MQLFQVLPNKTIRAPNGGRFIARGVTMFDYLFCSFESRTNYDYRSIYNPSWAGPSTGVSEPTYYARVSYKNIAYVTAQIAKAYSLGVNMIRIGVEPAIMYATTSYVDPVDSNTYPSDLTMLDNIISIANQYGMVVQLQNSNDSVPLSLNLPFLSFLAARYYTNPYVWINPANELNGSPANAANVNNATLWTSMQTQYLNAIRAPIAGGGQFLNPVSLDPPGWASRIDLIASTLTAAPFCTDPNLVINIHYYPSPGDYDFRTCRLPSLLTQWVNYAPQFCVLIGEVGINNFGANYDPNLDGASTNLTTWGQMQSAVGDFLQWTNQQFEIGMLNGALGEMWYGYIPSVSLYDYNSMSYTSGALTTWGQIFVEYLLSPQYSPTLKSAAELWVLASLNSRISNGTIGTPTFQAEGLTGARAAAAFVMDAASDCYVGFHSRATGISTGTITGDGHSGVLYTTASDYRLKDNPEDIAHEEALEAFKRLRPVMAGWKSSQGGNREMMFIAHELQDIIPSAVTGQKDGRHEDGSPIYQTVDYARLTPLIVAALRAALERVDALESAMSSAGNDASS